MDPLAVAVRGYTPQGCEEAHTRRLSGLIEEGDPWSRDGPLHVTASALVVDTPARRLLLRWHTRMERWMQVGGHAEPGERDPWLVALREAREETGLSDLRSLTPALERRPVQIVIVPVPAHGAEDAHQHADIRYALRTAEPDLVVAERAAADVRWVDILDAEAHIAEENLRECLRRVKELLIE